MQRIMLIRPGSTEFDHQGRMKGILNIPLSEEGRSQVTCVIQKIAQFELNAVYCGPADSARETARLIGEAKRLRPTVVEDLHNVDHGLWHGKRVEEVKLNQPRIYRQCQDQPGSFCPPMGESLASAQQRVDNQLSRTVKRLKTGSIAIVVPEPLATLLACRLQDIEIEDIWRAEADRCQVEVFERESLSVSTWRRVPCDQLQPEVLNRNGWADANPAVSVLARGAE